MIGATIATHRRTAEALAGAIVNAVGPVIYTSSTPGSPGAQNAITLVGTLGTASGQIAVNGTIIAITSFVVSLYYVDHCIFQFNGTDWYGPVTPGNAGSQLTGSPAPTVALSNNVLAPNSASGTVVGTLSVTNGLPNGTVGVGGYTWTYSLSGTGSSNFKIVGSSLASAVANLAGGPYTFTITATPNPAILGGPFTLSPTITISASGIMPSRAFAFLDTIGINGYIDKQDPQYNNTAQAVADAVYFGATKWREPLSDSALAISGMQALINAGFQFSIIPYGGDDNYNISQLHNLVTAWGTAAPIRWLEGPNEPDHAGGGWMPTFITTQYGNEGGGYIPMAHYMAELYTLIKADGVLQNIMICSPTDDGSEDSNVGLQFAQVPAGGGGTSTAGGTHFYDCYNIHDYPNWNNQAVGLIDPSGVTLNGNPDVINERLGEQFVTTRIGGYAGNSLAVVNASPRIMTEFNWATSEINDATKRAVAVSNAYLIGFKKGMQALIIYALYPDGVGNEVFSAPAAPLPVATVMHNLTTILHDPSGTAASFTTTPINVTLTGLPADGMWFLLQKASGHHQVVLWRNTTNYNRSTGQGITITPVNVTVNTGGSPTTISLYNPLVGTAPTSTLTSVTSIVVALADNAQIVDIT